MCFPLLSCTTRNVFIKHAVYWGRVHRATAYIFGILCAEGTNTVCGGGRVWRGSSMQSPYSPCFFDRAHVMNKLFRDFHFARAGTSVFRVMHHI